MKKITLFIIRGIFSFFASSVKGIAASLGDFFIEQVRYFYNKYYPLPTELMDVLKNVLPNPAKRIAELEEIRTNNIVTALWSNAGTVIALALTILSFVFTIFWTLSTFFSFPNLATELYQVIVGKVVNNSNSLIWIKLIQLGLNLLFFALMFFFSFWFTVLITPPLLRRIVKNLPPDEYGKISLTELGHSKILTFVSLKMWELCDNFEKSVNIPTEIEECLDIENDNFNSSKFFGYPRQKRKELLQKMRNDIEPYKATYYKHLSNCTSLKKEATNILGILPREFCHHILQFSTAIFEMRVNSFHSSVETIIYILNLEQTEDKKFQEVVDNNIKEIKRIQHDIVKLNVLVFR